MVDRYHLIEFYYLATPLFMLADAVFGANIRVTALEYYPVLKYAYYLVCIGCAILIRIKPELAGTTAFVESAVNLFFLILGLFAPYYRLVGRLADGKISETQAVFAPEVITNFIISSTICVIGSSFKILSYQAGRHDRGKS